jgi:hypothetical protein
MTTPSQPGDDLNVEDLDVTGGDADAIAGGDLKLEGIKGESLDKPFKDQIEIR